MFAIQCFLHLRDASFVAKSCNSVRVSESFFEPERCDGDALSDEFRDGLDNRVCCGSSYLFIHLLFFVRWFAISVHNAANPAVSTTVVAKSVRNSMSFGVIGCASYLMTINSSSTDVKRVSPYLNIGANMVFPLTSY